MRWSNDELLGTSVIDTTIPAVYHSDMLNIINLPSLAKRRLRTRLVMIMMYKVSFHLVAVPSDILIVSDTRTRKYHPLTYIFNSEHRELYSNMGMRMQHTICLMMRLKSFRPEVDKNWQSRRKCQKYKKKSPINDFKTKMIS